MYKKKSCQRNITLNSRLLSITLPVITWYPHIYLQMRTQSNNTKTCTNPLDILRANHYIEICLRIIIYNTDVCQAINILTYQKPNNLISNLLDICPPPFFSNLMTIKYNQVQSKTRCSLKGPLHSTLERWDKEKEINKSGLLNIRAILYPYLLSEYSTADKIERERV
jgi:hypothetical protein